LNDPQDAANPEDFWAEVLSADPDRIREALHRLPGPERASVLEHLRRMASDPGWQPGQPSRARAALEAIEP
jgi:hypothetical protein